MGPRTEESHRASKRWIQLRVGDDWHHLGAVPTAASRASRGSSASVTGNAEDACRACGHRSHEPRECSDDRRVASGKEYGCEAWTDGPVGGPSSTIEDVFALEINRLFRPAPLMKNFSPIAIKRTTYCNDAILVPAKLGPHPEAIKGPDDTCTSVKYPVLGRSIR